MSGKATRAFNHTLYQLIVGQKKRLRTEERQNKIQSIKKIHRDLLELGFILRDVKSFKSKHIDALVASWKQKGLSVGRIKNLMAHLRFVVGIQGRDRIMKENSASGIGSRCRVSSTNRAIVDPDFSGIQDRGLLLSLQLQRVFGLRREECLKIKPHVADEGAYLRLQGSWTKGGIGRIVPIVSEEQRYWLEKAKAFVISEDTSMIPPERSYIQQRKRYDRLTHEAGFKRLHGLRHAYAQRRYRELTGWDAPINGGKLKKSMTEEEKHVDQQARFIVSHELGHSRLAITRTYLG